MVITDLVSPALPSCTRGYRTNEARACSGVAVSRKVEISPFLLPISHFMGGLKKCPIVIFTSVISHFPSRIPSGDLALMTLHVNLGPQLLEQVDSSELTSGPGTLELLYFGCNPSFASLETNLCQ